MALFLVSCRTQSVAVEYDNRLYIRDKGKEALHCAIWVIDERSTDKIGELLSTRGWKTANLATNTFFITDVRRAFVRDLEHRGVIVDDTASLSLEIRIRDLESTFTYESFRPVSFAKAALFVTLKEGGNELWSTWVDGKAPNTYFMPGRHVAGKNAGDALKDALAHLDMTKLYERAMVAKNKDTSGN